jgi:hypothetical protein
MAIERHKGYRTIKLLIEGGQIKELRQIFDHIPKSVVYRDLGVNYNRFIRLLKQVHGFKLEELYHLASLIEVDEKVVVDLAHAQRVTDKKKKK